VPPGLPQQLAGAEVRKADGAVGVGGDGDDAPRVDGEADGLGWGWAVEEVLVGFGWLGWVGWVLCAWVVTPI